MTYEEAIKYFKNHLQSYCVTGVCKEAEELAIKVLQKQVPMKPIAAFFEGKVDTCPKCNRIIRINEKMCKCGQKIDWSEIEE